MKTKNIHKRTRWLLTALMLSALGSWTASAALIEVDQTIWGMDCAPCAYAMGKNLKTLAGVEHVTVSLNKGEAVVKFAPDNSVTLAEVEQTVHNSGFTPKGATIKASGTLKKEGGQLRLDVGKASYILKPSNKAKDAWQRLQKAAQDATVILTGQTATNHIDQITVLGAKP